LCRYAVLDLPAILAKFAADPPLLLLQSSEPLWSLGAAAGGTVRSEVVGFRKDMAEFLFEGQDEARSAPMEAVLKARAETVAEMGGRVELLPALEIGGGREGKVLDGSGRAVEYL
jgi:hypothetical protein